MKTKIINLLKFVFFLGLGLFLLWWVWNNFPDNQKEEIITALKTANYIWLIPLGIMAFISNVSRAIRWQMLITPTTNHKPGLFNVFSAVMIGYIANLAFPRLGEVSRCGIIAKYENIPFEKVLGTVITERIIDVISLLILILIVFFTQLNVIGSFVNEKIFSPLINKLSSANIFIYLLGLIIVLVVWFIFKFVGKSFKQSKFYQKIQHLIEGMIDGIKSVKKVKNMPLFLLHSCLIWIMYTLMVYFCFFTLQGTSSLGINEALAVLVIGSFAMIVTQGGVGAYQTFVSNLLVLYGIEKGLGFTFGCIAWGAQILFILLIGFALLIILPLVNQQKLNTNKI